MAAGQKTSVWRVYGDPRSTCSRKVLQVFYELGREFDLVQVDLTTKSQKDPQYLHLHPFGKVPVLMNTLTGYSIFESLAIIRYLADVLPTGPSPLIPPDAEGRGRMEQWLSVSYSYFKPVQHIIQFEMINKARYGLGEPDQGSVEKARSNLNSVLDILNNRLEEAPYFAGSEFSLADIAYMPEMEYLVMAGSDDLIQARPALADWWSRCRNRPAWQKVLSTQPVAGSRPFASIT